MSRFCLDEDLPIPLADELNQRGYDAVSAKREVALRGSRDEAVFLFCVQEGRVLVTHNEADFTLLHHAWCLWPLQIEHPGVLVVPQRFRLSLSELAEAISAFASTSTSTNNRLFRLLWRGRGRARAWEEPYRH